MRRDKKRAILLRKQGKSYNAISKILGIPKSTLSLWIKDIKMPIEIERKFWDRTRKKWARNITKFNKKRAEIARERVQQIQKIASGDIKKISNRELFLLGIALYWAEGCKKSRWRLDFSNSDPIMIKLMMKFFREICHIKENKFFTIVQIHPNTTPEKAVRYWSKLTKISKKQFLKTYTKLSPTSKRKRSPNILPYGTLRLSVSDVELTNKMKGWIVGLGKLFN